MLLGPTKSRAAVKTIYPDLWPRNLPTLCWLKLIPSSQIRSWGLQRLSQPSPPARGAASKKHISLPLPVSASTAFLTSRDQGVHFSFEKQDHWSGLTWSCLFVSWTHHAIESQLLEPWPGFWLCPWSSWCQLDTLTALPHIALTPHFVLSSSSFPFWFPFCVYFCLHYFLLLFYLAPSLCLPLCQNYRNVYDTVLELRVPGLKPRMVRVLPEAGFFFSSSFIEK